MRPNRLRFRGVFIAIVTLYLASHVYAANWYVKPSSAGSNSGADWNNAWSISGIAWTTVQGGDTIWLAGGTYTGNNSQLVTGASGTAGNVINIWRVRSTDSIPVSSPGWSPSFDSQVILQYGVIDIPVGGHLSIDGRIMSGILVTEINGGNGHQSMTAATGDVTDIWMSHIEFIGSPNTTTLTNLRYAVNWIGYYVHSTSNSTIDHCIIHQTNEAIRKAVWSNNVVQYCIIYDCVTDNMDHNDTQYTNDSPVSGTEIWRFNTLYNSESDGIYFDGGGFNGSFYFYGNVVWNYKYFFICTDGANSQGPGKNGPIYIYNNTFGGKDSGSNYGWLNFSGSTPSVSRIYNNLFYNGYTNHGTYQISGGYNAFYPSSFYEGEANSFGLSTNPFVNAAAGDFHLTAAAAALLTKGTPLTADGFINKDMNGNLRGSAGWIIGAYQSSGSGAPPNPPQNLHITVNP